MAYKADWITKGRNGEVIGGGYLVMRRGRGTGRARPSKFPFEYDTIEAAAIQAGKLSEMFPGQKFDVMLAVESHFVPNVEAIIEKAVEPA